MTVTPPPELYIGIMSGTSMDGIDAVCADCTPGAVKSIITHHSHHYHPDFKQQLLNMQQPQPNELHRCQILAAELARQYAAVVASLLNKTGLKAEAITAVGCHGQTVRHCPADHYSLQLNNWALLAELTGIPVIGDFRAGDLAAGGQGAPLVPLFHEMMFADCKNTTVILNIGGIANITVLSPGKTPLGFDTGPGNMLLDAWMYKCWQLACDRDGSFSVRGQVIETLLNAFIAQTAFFRQPVPKSTGRDLFSLEWLQNFKIKDYDPYDVLMTILELSAVSITAAINRYAPDAREILVCGGGVYNKTLMTNLQVKLAPRRVVTTAARGIDPLHVEAAAFAWLAYRRRHYEYGNEPGVTGAVGARVLGAVWHPFAPAS